MYHNSDIFNDINRRRESMPNQFYMQKLQENIPRALCHILTIYWQKVQGSLQAGGHHCVTSMKYG
jgi:hypothetical protein